MKKFLILINIALQSLNQSQNVDASIKKQNKNGNPKVPHELFHKSKYFARYSEDRRVLFSPNRSSIHYSQPTQKMFARACNPIPHLLYTVLTELTFQVKSPEKKGSKFKVILHNYRQTCYREDWYAYSFHDTCFPTHNGVILSRY